MPKRRELTEQRVLAGVASKYDYTLREDDGSQQVALTQAQDRAAADLASAFKRLGRTSDTYGAGGWSTSAEIEVPEDEGDDMVKKFTFNVGSQWAPKGGYQFYIELWAPMRRSKELQALHAKAAKALKGMAGKFRKFGDAKVPVDKPGEITKLWIDIPDDKINQAIKDLPKAVAELAKPIDRALKG